jgi:hypothetical protein
MISSGRVVADEFVKSMLLLPSTRVLPLLVVSSVFERYQQTDFLRTH